MSTLKSVGALPNPRDTSVSIITHPSITIEVLKEAAKAGVRRVWFQPGAWDEDCVKFAKESGMDAVVYGHAQELGNEACVLVHGEAGLAAAQRGKL